MLIVVVVELFLFLFVIIYIKVMSAELVPTTTTGKSLSNPFVSGLFEINQCPTKRLLPVSSMYYQDITTGVQYWRADEIDFNKERIKECQPSGTDIVVFYIRPDPKVGGPLPKEDSYVHLKLIQPKEHKGKTIHRAYVLKRGYQMSGSATERKTDYVILNNFVVAVNNIS